MKRPMRFLVNLLYLPSRHHGQLMPLKSLYLTASLWIAAHGICRHHDQLTHVPHMLIYGTTITGRYLKEYFLPHVHIFRERLGDTSCFIDDTPCHSKATMQDYLDSKDIHCLVWLSRFLNQNPIEKALIFLEETCCCLTLPSNKQGHFNALKEE